MIPSICVHDTLRPLIRQYTMQFIMTFDVLIVLRVRACVGRGQDQLLTWIGCAVG